MADSVCARVSYPITLWFGVIEVRNMFRDTVHRNAPKTAVRSQVARDPIPTPRPTALRQDVTDETGDESASADATRSPSPTH